MELIPASAMLGYPELVSSLGRDPRSILAPLGLRVEDCGDADLFVPLRNAILAAEKAATETRTPDFGRRLADHQGIEILGPVGVAARTANSFGAALAIFEKFMAAYSPAIAVRVNPGSSCDVVFWEWQVSVDPPVGHPQTEELSLGIMLRILRLLLGSSYRPLSAHITKGPTTSAAEYRRYFGCPVRFNERAAGFVLPAADLERPLAEDPGAHRAALDDLSTVISECTTSATRAVASLAGPLLPSGIVTVEMVAAQFGLHAKTLQRRLATEGTSFTAVIDHVRRDTAARLLRDTDMSLIHLTHQLGFAEQAVLTRACQRWFGRTPSAHRAALRDQSVGTGDQIS
jgi:AraC-like DNA-binding protein